MNPNINTNANENKHLLHSPHQGYHSIPVYHWISHSQPPPQRNYSPLPQTFRPHHFPTAPSDIIYVDTAHDNAERKRKFALVAVWTAAVLASVAIVFGLATLLMLREIREDRDLEHRHIHIQQIPQPIKFKEALKQANVIHLNGGVSTFLSNNLVLWSFRETLYTNQETKQVQLSPNSALIAEVDSKKGEIKRCKFLVDSEGNPTPLMMPISSNKKVAAQISGPGILTDKSKAFVFWDYQTIQDESHVPLLNYTAPKVRSVLPSFGKSEVVVNNSVVLSEESDDSSTTSHKILTLFHIDNKVRHDPEDSRAPFAVLDPDNQYVYLYFQRKVGQKEENSEKVDIVLARVPVSEISNPTPKYQFYTGKPFVQFSSEVSLDNSPAIFSEWSSDSSLSIAWNDYLKRYCIMVTSSDGQITLRTSQQPHGKWSAAVLVVPRSSKDVVHSASFHKEMWKEDGRVMILSYSVQDKNTNELLSRRQTPQLLSISIRKEYKAAAVLS